MTDLLGTLGLAHDLHSLPARCRLILQVAGRSVQAVLLVLLAAVGVVIIAVA